MIDDLAHLTPDLVSLGWDDELDAWAEAEAADIPGAQPGRIARVSRGFSLVFTGGEAVLAASASIRAQSDEEPATGDFVLVQEADAAEDEPAEGEPAEGEPADDQAEEDEAEEEAGTAVLAAIAPRRTTLARRAAGRLPEPQVLAANIDTVFVMHGLDRELNVRRIERQLVVSWDSGAQPVIILTKADTCDDPSAAVAEVQAAAPGVEVLAVSVEEGVPETENLQRVSELVGDGKTVALMGLSGIGKSTLVNALTGGAVQRTGEVRTTDRRGRHTTVTRDLIPIPGGGLLIDTPGIREIGLWQAYDGMAKTFPIIAELVPECRFANCEHLNEPGCAVRAAVANGSIEPRRLDHWRDLQAELELQETQLEEWARRADSRDRAEAERRRDDERANTKHRSRADTRRKSRQGGGKSTSKGKGKKSKGKRGRK